MATSIRLAPEIEQRLDFLAIHTGRSKAYYLREIIESGIDVTDEVIVEGQNKVQIGQAVEAVETTREEMEESATKAAADQHGLAK